jgi:hypothetical protein
MFSNVYLLYTDTAARTFIFLLYLPITPALLLTGSEDACRGYHVVQQTQPLQNSHGCIETLDGRRLEIVAGARRTTVRLMITCA